MPNNVLLQRRGIYEVEHIMSMCNWKKYSKYLSVASSLKSIGLNENSKVETRDTEKLIATVFHGGCILYTHIVRDFMRFIISHLLEDFPTNSEIFARVLEMYSHRSVLLPASLWHSWSLSQGIVVSNGPPMFKILNIRNIFLLKNYLLPVSWWGNIENILDTLYSRFMLVSVTLKIFYLWS